MKMTQDDINDLSVVIVNKFVEEGLVKDCTDTDDETEFEFQDAIREVLEEKFMHPGCGDYLEHLNPIIDDVKDGEPEPLSLNTIDNLMEVLRAKVEFREGHISEQECIRRVHSAWD